MNKPTVLCYPKCGTCQKAEKWLKANNIAYNYRPIKEENPTAEEVASWLKQSGLSINKFFNTSGLLYKEQNMKAKVNVLPVNELIDILATNGLLVKRPILLLNDTVLVGFKEEEWKTLFEK